MKVFVLYLLSIYSSNRMITDSRVRKSNVLSGFSSFFTSNDFGSEKTAENCEQKTNKCLERETTGRSEPDKSSDNKKKKENGIAGDIISPELVSAFSLFNFLLMVINKGIGIIFYSSLFVIPAIFGGKTISVLYNYFFK
ncbi:hypothetical protein NCER_101570 [Vairimorpha ceranae BRL01]|uniref:Uncharacterized protein n=1 Tax=Vairimorpha ceranae (strain BRL01) TaxID=578460 RepID=C4VAB5_VAIC1|nr:hypothetical protein NCER_101570 [Vairimorpha ceranae BRL01]